MSVEISVQALEILMDEPGHLLKLYAWMCRDIDKDSVAGRLRRRINEQYIKECLTVCSIQGRKGSVPSRAEIRNTVTRLIKLNLIVEVDQFVYHLPYEKESGV